ncbi:hypothetical protein ON010_g10527 [Phytophthora cinnamomi]|nr:hypothetical protein ON010_g10527 [Phytophthora cinnamomi]
MATLQKGTTPIVVVSVDFRPNGSHRVYILAVGANEAAQLVALGSRASATLYSVAGGSGELDVPDARVVIVLAPVGLDSRDMLTIAGREYVSRASATVVVQGSRGVGDLETNAISRSPVRIVTGLTYMYEVFGVCTSPFPPEKESVQLLPIPATPDPFKTAPPSWLLRLGRATEMEGSSGHL